MKFLIRILIWIYQRVISPPLHWIGGPNSGCRFEPTCSQYFLEAVETCGVIKGSWLGVRRICRCNPWGGFGFDPVPGSARDLASREIAARAEEEKTAAGGCGCDRDLGQLTQNAKT